MKLSIIYLIYLQLIYSCLKHLQYKGKRNIDNYVIYNKSSHDDSLIKHDHPIEQQQKKYTKNEKRIKLVSYIRLAW